MLLIYSPYVAFSVQYYRTLSPEEILQRSCDVGHWVYLRGCDSNTQMLLHHVQSLLQSCEIARGLKVGKSCRGPSWRGPTKECFY